VHPHLHPHTHTLLQLKEAEDDVLLFELGPPRSKPLRTASGLGSAAGPGSGVVGGTLEEGSAEGEWQCEDGLIDWCVSFL
jgi:hypothetical protein